MDIITNQQQQFKEIIYCITCNVRGWTDHCFQSQCIDWCMTVQAPMKFQQPLLAWLTHEYLQNCWGITIFRTTTMWCWYNWTAFIQNRLILQLKIQYETFHQQLTQNNDDDPDRNNDDDIEDVDLLEILCTGYYNQNIIDTDTRGNDILRVWFIQQNKSNHILYTSYIYRHVAKRNNVQYCIPGQKPWLEYCSEFIFCI
jgi:hypothetical protein